MRVDANGREWPTTLKSLGRKAVRVRIPLNLGEKFGELAAQRQRTDVSTLLPAKVSKGSA